MDKECVELKSKSREIKYNNIYIYLPPWASTKRLGILIYDIWNWEYPKNMGRDYISYFSWWNFMIMTWAQWF